MKRRQDGHRMRINRLSFWDSISVWISSLSRSRIESRLKFLVSEIGTLLCFPLSYDYWISFSPPLLFFPLLSSFFFFYPFFILRGESASVSLQSYFFNFFGSREVENTWMLKLNGFKRFFCFVLFSSISFDTRNKNLLY